MSLYANLSLDADTVVNQWDDPSRDEVALTFGVAGDLEQLTLFGCDPAALDRLAEVAVRAAQALRAKRSHAGSVG